MSKDIKCNYSDTRSKRSTANKESILHQQCLHRSHSTQFLSWGQVTHKFDILLGRRLRAPTRRKDEMGSGRSGFPKWRARNLCHETRKVGFWVVHFTSIQWGWRMEVCSKIQIIEAAVAWSSQWDQLVSLYCQQEVISGIDICLFSILFWSSLHQLQR